jgi:hypothetical protein
MIRVSADLIRDVAKALDTVEGLPIENAEFLLDKPIRFYSDSARDVAGYEFRLVHRFDEDSSTTYFEVIL